MTTGYEVRHAVLQNGQSIELETRVTGVRQPIIATRVRLGAEELGTRLSSHGDVLAPSAPRVEEKLRLLVQRQHRTVLTEVLGGEEAYLAGASAPGEEPSRLQRHCARAASRLAEIAAVEGVVAAGVFVQGGEPFAFFTPGAVDFVHLAQVGNSALVSARAVSIGIGVEPSREMHVDTEQTHMIVRCFDAGDCRTAPEPHVHVIVVVDPRQAEGAARFKLNWILSALEAALALSDGAHSEGPRVSEGVPRAAAEIAVGALQSA